MSHFLTIPINENGIIIDQNIYDEIHIAAIAPFQFTDVFVYSHGWWNNASSAVSEYNIFSIGFSKVFQNLVVGSPTQFPSITTSFSALAMGVHWPSTISEDQNAVSNFLEATSFFTMERRADGVGDNGVYALLRLLIEAREGEHPLRFHLIGHSFGARVLCSALQALAQDAQTLALAAAIGAKFYVALIQAATDTDSLAAGKKYGDVLTKIPNLRMLITTSKNDTALGKWYPAAQNLAHLFKGPTPAMGDAGPTGALPMSVSDRFNVLATPVHQPAGSLAVADLTPLHTAHAVAWGNQGGWGGQHSDINLPEIYELLTRFFGN